MTFGNTKIDCERIAGRLWSNCDRWCDGWKTGNCWRRDCCCCNYLCTYNNCTYNNCWRFRHWCIYTRYENQQQEESQYLLHKWRRFIAKARRTRKDLILRGFRALCSDEFRSRRAPSSSGGFPFQVHPLWIQVLLIHPASSPPLIYPQAS